MILFKNPIRFPMIDICLGPHRNKMYPSCNYTEISFHNHKSLHLHLRLKLIEMIAVMLLIPSMFFVEYHRANYMSTHKAGI